MNELNREDEKKGEEEMKESSGGKGEERSWRTGKSKRTNL